MTFLQIVLSYAPAWMRGGPPRVMYDYARLLAAQGHRVLVLAPDSYRPSSDWTGFPEGVEVHYFRKFGGPLSRFYFDYSRSDLLRFFAKFHREIDVAHLTQTRSLPNVVALQACRRYRIPYLLSSFGSLPRRHSAGKWFYDQLFVRPLLNRAALLLGQTDNECATYAAYGGPQENIRLLPLGVDLTQQPTQASNVREQFLTRFGIPADSHVFLFVGRLHPTKGISFLIRAFARVCEQEPRSFLALVGHDEGVADEASRIAADLGIANRLRLCGPLYDADRWQAYLAADTFIITPNVYEETSLASIEALACGTPVVTNIRADIPHLEKYGAGFLIRPQEDAAIAAMLTLIREDAKERAIRRKAALRLAEEVFEIRAVTTRLVAYASEVVCSRPREA
jgi:glycosyltransferase involved in cell wall biosynthesis